MPTLIGLYGGSFDPIHIGHLIIARAVAESLDLERVIFLPSARPPHKQPGKLAGADHRAQMVRLAIEGDSIFELSDYDLTRSGPTYTVETIDHFATALGPQAHLHWIIGADSLIEIPTWKSADKLIDTCRIITAARPGSSDIDWSAITECVGEPRAHKLREGIVETPMIDVSSTQIRRRLGVGRSIRHLTPDLVHGYIYEHHLYGVR
jgi:nicotinate-nucleotide adenylyltransferase